MSQGEQDAGQRSGSGGTAPAQQQQQSRRTSGGRGAGGKRPTVDSLFKRAAAHDGQAQRRGSGGASSSGGAGAAAQEPAAQQQEHAQREQRPEDQAQPARQPAAPPLPAPAQQPAADGQEAGGAAALRLPMQVPPVRTSPERQPPPESAPAANAAHRDSSQPAAGSPMAVSPFGASPAASPFGASAFGSPLAASSGRSSSPSAVAVAGPPVGPADAYDPNEAAEPGARRQQRSLLGRAASPAAHPAAELRPSSGGGRPEVSLETRRRSGTPRRSPAAAAVAARRDAFAGACDAAIAQARGLASPTGSPAGGLPEARVLVLPVSCLAACQGYAVAARPAWPCLQFCNAACDPLWSCQGVDASTQLQESAGVMAAPMRRRSAAPLRRSRTAAAQTRACLQLKTPHRAQTAACPPLQPISSRQKPDSAAAGRMQGCRRRLVAACRGRCRQQHRVRQGLWRQGSSLQRRGLVRRQQLRQQAAVPQQLAQLTPRLLRKGLSPWTTWTSRSSAASCRTSQCAPSHLYSQTLFTSGIMWTSRALCAALDLSSARRSHRVWGMLHSSSFCVVGLCNNTLSC